jgi:glycosyltransferase involved in cell wall biosynthesis
MNVLMMTNSYVPFVSGVVRSIQTFSRALREQGHNVLIVAPAQEGSPEHEPDVVRMPAIQHVTDNDYSIRLPIPGYLTKSVDEFQPDVVHAHHPMLLGDTGLRIAAGRNLPVVFTHHTMYEHYAHYFSDDSVMLERFVSRLATEFANLCDHVIAPSQSVAGVLRERGVETPLTVIPTGIDVGAFTRSRGAATRRRLKIPKEAFVVGYVGRLAPEKNLDFLVPVLADFVRSHPDAHALFVGDGSSREDVLQAGREAGLEGRWHSTGSLTGKELTDAYAALSVFAFSSVSETQGMVLAEAMAAGVPVVAVDASGVRDIVDDGANGRVIEQEDRSAFIAAIEEIAAANQTRRSSLRKAARAKAAEYSTERCVEKLVGVYRQVRSSRGEQESDALWAAAIRRIDEEVKIWKGVGRAVVEAVRG